MSADTQKMAAKCSRRKRRPLRISFVGQAGEPRIQFRSGCGARCCSQSIALPFCFLLRFGIEGASRKFFGVDRASRPPASRFPRPTRSPPIQVFHPAIEACGNEFGLFIGRSAARSGSKRWSVCMLRNAHGTSGERRNHRENKSGPYKLRARKARAIGKVSGGREGFVWSRADPPRLLSFLSPGLHQSKDQQHQQVQLNGHQQASPPSGRRRIAPPNCQSANPATDPIARKVVRPLNGPKSSASAVKENFQRLGEKPRLHKSPENGQKRR